MRLGITVRLHSLAKNSDTTLLNSPGLANVSQCPHRGKIPRHKNLTPVTPYTSVLLVCYNAFSSEVQKSILRALDFSLITGLSKIIIRPSEWILEALKSKYSCCSQMFILQVALLTNL
jgi:hypothetical protein